MLAVGDRVYVDEGDSIGCREYSGVIVAMTANKVKVRLDNGKHRFAELYMCDPA